MKQNEIKVGWYAFEGGKFSPNPNAYPNCQGVVAWLNPKSYAPIGQQGLILTPDEVRLEWSDEYIKVGIWSEEDGQANTCKLIACGKRYGIKFSAAEWCHSYSKNGVTPGEGFLPAKYQLRKSVTNRDIINPALEKIGGTILKNWLWTSSELFYHSAWCVNASDGALYSHFKPFIQYVRCFLAF